MSDTTLETDYDADPEELIIEALAAVRVLRRAHKQLARYYEHHLVALDPATNEYVAATGPDVPTKAWNVAINEICDALAPEAHPKNAMAMSEALEELLSQVDAAQPAAAEEVAT